MRIVLLLVGAVLVAGLVGGAYFLGQKQTAPVPAPTTPTATTPTPTSLPTVAPAPTDPNLKTFTSSELGISFNYLEKQNDQVYEVKANKNKVSFYTVGKWPPGTETQYLQVFAKDKNDDLKMAIEKRFLANYSKTDCFAKIGENPVAKQTVPATFVFAQITVPISPNDGMEELSAKWDKCPSPYTTTNGIAYFVMDTNHPDKFVFLSIGQYAIDAPTGPWQSTLRFL